MAFRACLRHNLGDQIADAREVSGAVIDVGGQTGPAMHGRQVARGRRRTRGRRFLRRGIGQPHDLKTVQNPVVQAEIGDCPVKDVSHACRIVVSRPHVPPPIPDRVRSHPDPDGNRGLSHALAVQVDRQPGHAAEGDRKIIIHDRLRSPRRGTIIQLPPPLPSCM